MGNLVLEWRSVSLNNILNFSKEFVFYGEKSNGRVTEFESRDVVFLEKDYFTRGEIDKDLQLYEMEDLDYGTPSN